MSNTNTRLRVKVAHGDVLAEPLLDQHCERRSDKTQNEARKPEGVGEQGVALDGKRGINGVDNSGVDITV